MRPYLPLPSQADRDFCISDYERFPGYEHVPRILLECTDKEATRYSLNRPWLSDINAYATDGRICVRVPQSRLTPEAINALDDWPHKPNRVPKASHLFNVFDKWAIEPVPIPDVPDPLEPCPSCNGKGKTEFEVTCEECDGSGEDQWLDDDDKDDPDFCEFCDGDGMVPEKCSACRGTGLKRDPESDAVQVAPSVWLSSAYVFLIRQYGVDRVWLSADKPGMSMVRFEVPGQFEGRFMPVCHE